MAAQGTTGSTMPRRRLGRQLRDLRNRARMTTRAAAQQLEWSEAKIWRIETGQTSLRGLDVEAMCKVYGAPPEAVAPLTALAKETKARGWWTGYSDVIGEGFDVYIGLRRRRAAVRLRGPADSRPAANRGLCSRAAAGRAPGAVRFRYRAPGAVADGPPAPAHQGRSAVAAGCADRRGRAVAAAGRSFGDRGPARPSPADVRAAECAHPGGALGCRVPPRHRVRAVRAAGIPALDPGAGAPEPPVVYVEAFTGPVYLDKSHEIDRYRAAFDSIRAVAVDARTAIDDARANVR